jgi:hypothetical protein
MTLSCNDRDAARPIKIRLIFHDELHFVRRPEVLDVRPEIPGDHAASRAFDVHDAMNARIDRGNIQTSSGLQKCLITRVAERRQKLADAGLQQWFSTGHFDERAMDTGD